MDECINGFNGQKQKIYTAVQHHIRLNKMTQPNNPDYADSIVTDIQKLTQKSIPSSQPGSNRSSNSIHRSKTQSFGQGAKGSKAQDLDDDLMEDFEDSVCRRLSIAHTRRYGIKDIYETVPFFSGILKKRDREDLKKALNQEEFQIGDVLFNYQDIGDKFYMVMKGEVTIELPDPTIPWDEFLVRYEDYKEVLQHIDAKAELVRKKELVERRKGVLQEMMDHKESTITLNKDSVKSKDRSQIVPRVTSMNKHSKFYQKKSTSMAVTMNRSFTIMTRKSDDMEDFVEAAKVLPHVEELSQSGVSSSSDSQDAKNDRDRDLANEFDRAALEQQKKQEELFQLGNELKASFDAKLLEVHPKPFEHQATEFDKLRKRVTYLCKSSKNEKNQPFVPSNMQIHSKFISQDQEVRRQIRELKQRDGQHQDENESDSDESIQEIKNQKKKQLAKINLTNLSDNQIARLTMVQIANLEIIEPQLYSISQEQQDELLQTQWLTPQKTYERGGTFGERSLKIEDDKRAGTARCTATGSGSESCIVMTLTRQEYKRFIEKIELKTQAITNAFLKNLPMFSAWPTKALTKLQYAFTEVTLIRNQAVYNEGDSASHIYMICDGEFLLTKRVPVKAEHEIQLDKLIGPNSIFLQEQPDLEDQKVIKSSVGDMGPKSAAQTNPVPGKLGQQTLSKTKMHGAFKLIALSTGQLMGEDDVIAERPRLATATCVSQKGKVYRMDATEFFKKLEQNQDTKIEFHKQLYSKQVQMKTRQEMIQSIYNIKPSDILALVALDKAEGNLDVADGGAPKATRAASPQKGRQKSQSPQPQRSPLANRKQPLQATTPINIRRKNIEQNNSPGHGKKNESKSPKKKKKSYFVAPKQQNFNKVINEPFEIEKPNEFKELNNTRKVHYPMMLQKYNVDKVDEWNIDDFRRAMHIIVKKGDDDLFDKHLTKKSGRTSTQNIEREVKKPFVNSVYLEQSCAVENRTSPQRVDPKGFYSQSVEQSQDQMSLVDLPAWRIAQENSMYGNIQVAHHPNSSQSIQSFYSRHQNQQANDSVGNSKFGPFSLAGRASAPYGDQDPMQITNQKHNWLKHGSEAGVIMGESVEKPQENNEAININSSLQSFDKVSQGSVHIQHQRQHSNNNSFISGGRNVSQVVNNMNSTNPGEFMGFAAANVTSKSYNMQDIMQPRTAPDYQQQQNGIPYLHRRQQAQQYLGIQTGYSDNRNKSVQMSRQQQPYTGNRMLRQNRGVYSMAPSKTFMVRNTGKLQLEDNVMEKQVKQQLREQREALLMQQSVPAKILAQKKVKYFSVASTIRRPRRLTELV